MSVVWGDYNTYTALLCRRSQLPILQAAAAAAAGEGLEASNFYEGLFSLPLFALGGIEATRLNK